jgi:hypothetical protein
MANVPCGPGGGLKTPNWAVVTLGAATRAAPTAAHANLGKRIVDLMG